MKPSEPGAGNPILSTSNSRQLDKAFEALDFMVAIGLYINETTRHADIILPPASALEHDHYNIAFLRLAVRDTARFNEAVVDKPVNTRCDWDHNRPGIKLSIASEHSGVNVNDLTNDQLLDPVSGYAALNGVKVEVCTLQSSVLGLQLFLRF